MKIFTFFLVFLFSLTVSSCSDTNNIISVVKVELSQPSHVMSVGQYFNLTASITPSNATNKTLFWNTSNGNIASVSAHGTVNALSEGKAIITVNTECGNKSDFCEITVNPIAVSGIALLPATANFNLKIGQTQKLTTDITPADAANKGVNWLSSNTSVATVIDGLVTAVGIGASTITVSTVDGNHSASCQVTVFSVPVDNVSLSLPVLNMGLSETYGLNSIITPNDATNTAVNWKSSDTSVATVIDGVITAVSEGTTTITVTTDDGAKTATCLVRVYFIHEPELKVVDRFATKETKALFRNLLKIQDIGTMFGHHNSLMYGREWYDVSGRSDVKEICGDFPAVFSTDFAEIMDGRTTSLYGRPSATDIALRRRCILEAWSRGEVITACIHINNPLTGGSAWDNSNNTVVKQILTEGSNINTRYKIWLDRVADFANNLKDPSGTLIPVLFRPYHEHTQEWSWWGSRCATQAEFIDLWRWTIEYLRDIKGVRNFLYAISPQMDGDYGTPGTRNRFLFRWPGDEWVDFLGMDCYHWHNTAGYRRNLSVIVDIGKEKGIPVGVTETGITGIGWNENMSGSADVNYWTVQMLEPLKTTKQAKGSAVSMVIMWRNKYVGTRLNDTHFFGPWIGHPSTPNFMEFYEDPITIFSADIPFNMYE